MILNTPFETQFTNILRSAEPKDVAAVIEALRRFVQDHDGKPNTPTTPSQSTVNSVKDILHTLYN